MRRGSGARALYVFVVVAGLVFSGLLAGALLVERAGPSRAEQGVVTERASGTKIVETCRFITDLRRQSCSETTVGAFSVIGERDDGTPWAVVDEGAYRATSTGETLEVETSSVTGRVVGLRGRRDWHVSESSSPLVLASGFVAIAIVLVLLGEVNRRRGTSALAGSFRPVEFVTVVPAVLLAATGAWFALYNETRGIGLVSAEERTGGFLVPGPVGQERLSSNTIGGTLFQTVPLSAVAAEQRGDPGPGVIAIPITADRSSPLVGVGRLIWTVRVGDRVLEPVDCPSGVVPFPSRLAPDFTAGFLCFDALTGPGVLVGFHEIGTVGRGVGERYDFEIDPGAG